MKYHAPTNQFTVSPKDLQMAAHSLRWAIKHIRLASGRSLQGGKEHPGPMEDPDFAESGILDAAKNFGIDLGADRPGKLDVSDAG